MNFSVFSVHKKFLIVVPLIFLNTLSAQDSVEYKTLTDILYYPEVSDTSDYRYKRCRLDLYYPVNTKNFSTIIWFHGGGLSGGEKYIPDELKNKGVAIAAVNYRLSPFVREPEYIIDAARATAWVINNIKKYGGDVNRIVVSGHSAGAYLTLMVGLDSRWLQMFGLHPDKLSALVPLSPQVITHFSIRRNRGIKETTPVIDEFAPLYYVKAETPPILLVTGDRERELFGRYEENAYFRRMMILAGNKHTSLRELEGFDHGSMVAPGCLLLLDFIKELSK